MFHHVRRPTEYVAPQIRLWLDELVAEEDWVYGRWMRGTPYHAYGFDGYCAGAMVDLELVPEPYNPMDQTAVGVDFKGRRVGYLPAADAAVWHDIIRAANRAGVALWVLGELGYVQYDSLPEGSPVADTSSSSLEDDGGTFLVPMFDLPDRSVISDISDRFGLGEVIEEIVETLGPEVFDRLLEGAWEGVSDDIAAEVTQLGNEYPQLTWPSRSRGGLAGTAAGIPTLLYSYLRDEVYVRRRAKAEARVGIAAQRARPTAGPRETAGLADGSSPAGMAGTAQFSEPHPVSRTSKVVWLRTRPYQEHRLDASRFGRAGRQPRQEASSCWPCGRDAPGSHEGARGRCRIHR